MELEVIQNEFQRLSVDKQKVDETITKAELDLIRLKQNRDMLVGEALNLMNNKKITSLFICEKNKPIGIIHIHDLLRLSS